MDRLVFESFASYGKYWAESAKIGPGDRRHLDRRLKVTGMEHIRAAKASGGGASSLRCHTWVRGRSADPGPRRTAFRS